MGFTIVEALTLTGVCRDYTGLDRLDQAILAVIDNPEKTRQTTAIATLF